MKDMSEWWSIEILHGEFSADRWRDAHGSDLIESALTNGAVNWNWHQHDWGIVFEVCLADEDQWQAFRDLPLVRAALDAVPDRVNGLLIYRGRGGSAGTPSRRPKRPSAGAGALELPEPEAERILDLAASEVLEGDAPEPAGTGFLGPALASPALP
jgi:hypothetical protein